MVIAPLIRVKENYMKKTKLTIILILIFALNLKLKAQTPNKYVCLGSPFTLTSSDGLGHSWYKNGVFANADTVYTETPASGGVYTYTMISTASGGCTSPMSAPYVVSVLNTLSASISSPVTTVCSSLGNSVLLTCNPGYSGVNFQWLRNGVIIVGATNGIYLVSESVAGSVTYSCQVAYTVLPGCFITVSKVITVVNAPVAGAIR